MIIPVSDSSYLSLTTKFYQGLIGCLWFYSNNIVNYNAFLQKKKITKHNRLEYRLSNYFSSYTLQLKLGFRMIPMPVSETTHVT